jgi:hypothetical protein
VLGHDHISVDAQGDALAHLLQNLEKEVVDGGGVKASLPMVTSERHEVRLSGLLKTFQAMRHGETLIGSLLACSDG